MQIKKAKDFKCGVVTEEEDEAQLSLQSKIVGSTRAFTTVLFQ
jgi:hypothetical protein